MLLQHSRRNQVVKRTVKLNLVSVSDTHILTLCSLRKLHYCGSFGRYLGQLMLESVQYVGSWCCGISVIITGSAKVHFPSFFQLLMYCPVM